MIRKLVLAAAIMALATVAIPKASATVFDLNQAFCSTGCVTGSGPWGTVEVTASGGVVTIDVKLNAPLLFHDQGLDSFAFNGPAGLTADQFAVVTTSGTGWVLNPPLGGGSGNGADGAGSFLYSFECTAGANKCANETSPAEFKFTITGASLTEAMFETTNNGASNVDFAANVANQNGSGCTGMIGGGAGTTNSSPLAVTGSSTCTTPPPGVPEPTSVLLLGTGLLFAGKLLKAKLVVG